MGRSCCDSVAYLGNTWIPSSNLCRVDETVKVIFISLTTQGCISILLFHVFHCYFVCKNSGMPLNSICDFPHPHVIFILMLRTVSTSKNSGFLVENSLLQISKIPKKTRQENTVHVEVRCEALTYPAWYCRDILICMYGSPCKTTPAHGGYLFMVRIFQNLWSREGLFWLLGDSGGRVKCQGGGEEAVASLSDPQRHFSWFWAASFSDRQGDLIL